MSRTARTRLEGRPTGRWRGAGRRVSRSSRARSGEGLMVDQVHRRGNGWRRSTRAALTALTVLAAVLVIVPDAQAATSLYVDRNDPTCSDTGPGSAVRPFCTISRAAGIATPGQNVVVSEGTYVEEVVPVNSGTSTAPITYTAATGEDVVITGSV